MIASNSSDTGANKQQELEPNLVDRMKSRNAPHPSPALSTDDIGRLDTSSGEAPESTPLLDRKGLLHSDTSIIDTIEAGSSQMDGSPKNESVEDLDEAEHSSSQHVVKPTIAYSTAGQGPNARNKTGTESVQTTEEHLTRLIFQEPASVSNSSPVKSKLKLDTKLEIQKPDGNYICRCGRLDTGASMNLIAEEVFCELGIKMEPFSGTPFEGIGGLCRPKGKVTFKWNVRGKAKTYSDEFFVVEECHARGFDCLIGEDTIDRVGFLKSDDSVYWLKFGN